MKSDPYNGYMKSISSQEGQILLITLLILSVATTIALSLIGRTTTDMNISTQVEESSRAFSAAEAGIEEALKLGTAPAATTLSGGGAFTVTSDVIGASSVYTLPRIISKGDTATIWMVSHNDATGNLNETFPNQFNGDTVTICWGNASAFPAAEIGLVTHSGGPGSPYELYKYAFDINSGGHGNNFAAPVSGNPCGITGNTYHADIVIPVNSNPVMFRIKPLYADAWVGIQSLAHDLPKQGSTYNSCGSTEANVTRCIDVEQQYRTPLSIFDYVLYNQQGSL